MDLLSRSSNGRHDLAVALGLYSLGRHGVLAVAAAGFGGPGGVAVAMARGAALGRGGVDVVAGRGTSTGTRSGVDVATRSERTVKVGG